MMCSPCMVSGCLSCGESQHECKECKRFFKVNENGKCVAEDDHVWTVVYCIAGIIVLVLAYYLITLAWRPDVNAEVLERAQQFRKYSKLTFVKTSNRTGDTFNKLYPLDTNLTHQNVAGMALQMHFSWQRWMMVWTFIVMSTFLILSKIPVYSIDPAVD